ncbi:carbonic anhydrase 2 [Colletes latitarsis]|uniref:carbonic anhydrase 2 n=1 Tax=Colletes latitarsis TaxID=2605962 RepID=UPI004036D1F3
MILLIFTLGPLFLTNLVSADFGYDGNDGPSHWGENHKACLGKQQSPIDIEAKDVTMASYPPLEFSNLQNPHKANLTNNGHTVMIQSVDTELPTISGGPINDTYIFQQMHFHWGQNDRIGSEDLINNHSFSMELHAVFWKKSYETADEAMKHSDGLTVLGYLYQTTDDPNPIFDSIVSRISEIESAGSTITLDDSNVLNKLIAPDIVSAQNYYTYKGSLTTPPCLEIVQWIDFIDPLLISHDQLAAFRNIQSSDGKNVTHNFRPVQPLNGRVIYRNNIGEITETPNSTSGSMTTTTRATTAPTTAPATAPATAPTTAATTAAITAPTTTVGGKLTKMSTLTITSTSAPTTESMNRMDKNGSQHSGQERIWIASPFAVIFGIIFLLPYQ